MARTVEEIDARLAQLRAQRDALVRRRAARARKERTHALVVYGGMLVEACGGDWRAVDPARLAALLDSNRAAMASARGEALGDAEANARVRAWESARRDERRATREARG